MSRNIRNIMKINFIIAVFFLISSILFERTHADLSPGVQAISDEYWSWRLSDMPEYATFVGVHDYDDRLDDVSEAAQKNRVNKCEQFLYTLSNLEETITEDADIITTTVLRYELETFTDGFDLKGFYLPLNYLEGLHVDMETQFGWMLRESLDDYNKMLSRMENIPLRVDQTIDVMTVGVEEGITYCNISMKGMNDSLSRFVVSDPTDSPFYVYFASDFPSTFTEQDIASLQAQAKAIINADVTPAYEKLRVYVADEYVMRPDIAATSMTNGTQFYDTLIWFHTSTNYTPQEIHDLGLSEVDRIEAEMLQIVVEMGYPNMTVQEFSAMIRNDPNNYYDNSDDYFAAFETICYDLVPPHLGEIFKDLPVTELTLVNDPDPDGPGAFYLAGSYDGSRPGVFYVNTYDPSTEPKYAMLTLSLHEGNPGHHLQASHNIENPDTPYFRRVTEDRNYGISPSRFPLYTYYAEGWGLYSEKLGFDMNLYGDPLERYGHYSEEIFRACRLVVDTGMHALGWTREEAIDYMFSHTASNRGNIENEIDRYITWPGQALAYKIGELKIEEMRDNANSTLGDSFDLKEYHDIVLDSEGPLSFVEEQVNKWVASVISQK